MKTYFANIYENITQKLYKAFGGNSLYKSTIKRPENIVHKEDYYKSMKPTNEKYNHRPVSKPVVEKQTLLKEKKKAKTVH